MNDGSNDFIVRQAAPSYREIAMELGKIQLYGDLIIPDVMTGLVLFAHGSGSSRFSPRNRSVAQALNEAGFATCLFDLLTLDEEDTDQLTGAFRFDIGLLAERLVLATDWMIKNLEGMQPGITKSVPIGYFGASTGAAAALIAAADRPELVKAVVSRGGRPDLAAQALRRVQSPTLLLVGSLDDVVIQLNRQAYEQLPEQIPKELVVIPGASHLFEEPGKLEQVADYASHWFETYFATGEQRHD